MAFSLKWILLLSALAVVVSARHKEPRTEPPPIEGEEQGDNQHVREARQSGATNDQLPAEAAVEQGRRRPNPFADAAEVAPTPRTRTRSRGNRRRIQGALKRIDGVDDMEKVRGLLAEYRKKRGERHSRRKAQGKETRGHMSEELRKQLRARAAEQKAAEAKGLERRKSIWELNEAVRGDLYAGDILLTPEQAQYLVDNVDKEDAEGSGNSTHRRAKRGMMNFLEDNPTSKWDTSKVIYYAFDSTITSATKKANVKKAFDYYYNTLCFYFEETTADDDTKDQPILLFTQAETGCFATIGRVQRQFYRTQKVNLGSGCDAIGVALHEIGHSLGLWHTQERWDRETFIDVQWDNIPDGSAEDQFEIQSPSTNNNVGVKYDYGSMMHYGPGDLDAPDMLAKEAHMINSMGNIDKAAFSDLVMINTAYGCTQCTTAQYAYCKNGGVPNPNWCNQCICPFGFGGADCTTRPAATSKAKKAPGGASCGGAVTATTSWQYFEDTINPGATQDSGYNPTEACHWWVDAPVGKKVWVRVKSLDASCLGGCAAGGIEIKTKEFTRAGARICCDSDLDPGTGNIDFGGVDTKAIVSLFSRSFSQYIRVGYIAQ